MTYLLIHPPGFLFSCNLLHPHSLLGLCLPLSILLLFLLSGLLLLHDLLDPKVHCCTHIQGPLELSGILVFRLYVLSNHLRDRDFPHCICGDQSWGHDKAAKKRFSLPPQLSSPYIHQHLSLPSSQISPFAHLAIFQFIYSI